VPPFTSQSWTVLCHIPCIGAFCHTLLREDAGLLLSIVIAGGTKAACSYA
jgi:hypothetical protein